MMLEFLLAVLIFFAVVIFLPLILLAILLKLVFGLILLPFKFLGAVASVGASILGAIAKGLDRKSVV